MGYYVKCPYYINGQKKPTATIVCEDTHRDFGTVEKKNWQLEHVCQDDWKSCPFAQALNDLYERTEDMNLTRREKEHLQHTCEAQKSEMIKLKKRMKWSEHKMEQKERDAAAAEHLAQSRAYQIQKLKTDVLLHDRTSLNVEEILTALTISGATNPSAEAAAEKLSLLRGCRAHCTAILSDRDEQSLKALGIDVTCDPEYVTTNLYYA